MATTSPIFVPKCFLFDYSSTVAVSLLVFILAATNFHSNRRHIKTQKLQRHEDHLKHF